MKYLGVCLLVTWQLTWLCAMFGCIIESSGSIASVAYGSWLFVFGVTNLVVNIWFWIIVVIYLCTKDRAWIIVNTALVWIWVSVNIIGWGIGIYIFDQSSESIKIYNASIVLFVYLGIVLIGGLLGLYYGIYSGKCDKQHFCP